MPARRPLLPLALVLASVLLAGCAENPSPLGDAEAAHAGVTCPAGTGVVGFDAHGSPACAAPPAPADPLAGFSCPQGQFVQGFDAAGRPRCATPPPPALPPRPEAPAKEPVVEVGPGLKVLGIYGVRNHTGENLWDLKVNVELPGGAVPLDLTKLVLRYSDGATARNYAHAPWPLPDAYVPSAAFNATWIRGDGTHFVMEPGDLVQLHFNLVHDTLSPRTPVALSIIPETGAPIAADFRTPSTYGGERIITLR